MLFVFLVLFLILLLFIPFLVRLITRSRFLEDLRNLDIFEV